MEAVEGQSKISESPQRNHSGVRAIDQLPTTAWNLEDFLVPNKREKVGLEALC